jgi:hypothetical protein
MKNLLRIFLYCIWITFVFGQTSTVTLNTSTKITQPPVGSLLMDGAASFIITRGTGSPETNVTAATGSLYLDQNGLLWIKNSGTGNTGWSQLGVTGQSSTEGTWTYTAGNNTMADPANGKYRTDQSTFSASTNIAISKQTYDNIDRTNVLKSLKAGDTIELQDKVNATNYARYTLSAAPTNNTTWFQLPVTWATGGGTAPGGNSQTLYTFQYGGATAVTPGGANTNVQFNNSGVFGGNAGLTYNGSNTLQLTSTSGAPTVLIVNNGAGSGYQGNLQFYVGGTPFWRIVADPSGTSLYDFAIYNPAAATSELYLNGANLAVPPNRGIGWSAGGGYVLTPDTALARNAAGVVEVNSGTLGQFRDLKARSVIYNGYTVATLPAAVAGMTAYVTDGTAALAWGATVTGGGSTKYLCWYNGTAWTVVGK